VARALELPDEDVAPVVLAADVRVEALAGREAAGDDAQPAPGRAVVRLDADDEG
jgi:hypothetical protein